MSHAVLLPDGRWAAGSSALAASAAREPGARRAGRMAVHKCS